jgi:tripartite ATP-independent transporter DctM subunit
VTAIEAAGSAPRVWSRIEDGLSSAALLTMAALPVLEMISRALFNTGIPGSFGYVQHLTLWVAFLGAMLASRGKQHIMLSAGLRALPPKIKAVTDGLVVMIAASVAAGLTWASLEYVRSEMEAPERIGGWLPVWAAELILPVAFAAMTLRFIEQASGTAVRLLALLAIACTIGTGLYFQAVAGGIVWIGVIGLIVSAFFGTPLFVVLGGASLLLFFADAVPIAAIPVEIYRIVVSPSIPAIPLFTLTGYLLAEGGSSARLVRLFRALFGWMPGGLVIATTLVCAFFSTFTGASGVTILALGGLLLPILTQNGLSQRFSVGLITSTGSIGLLFPPSLAVILYGIVAQVPINDLYIAGLVPGLLMVLAVSLYGLRESLRTATASPSFDARGALDAAWEAKWELLLPVVALVAIFGGFTTLIEASALTVVYALVMQTLIHRDIDFTRDLPSILVKSIALIGGVFAILGVAMGLTNYMVDAMVTARAVEWVQQTIESRLIFLLALNVFLLVVGTVLDGVSAIVVVVPLIAPVSAAYGVDPLHLAVIFLINLELGYLSPPVGMNLFLAGLRFEQPMNEIFRSTLPFFLILLAVVLLVTYVPALTLGAQ